MNHASNLIDLKTGLSHTGLSAHEHAGFELGWDYAHHDTVPPAPYAEEDSPLRHGWLAGRAAFGPRTLVANRHVRKWLQLRLHAWLRGRSVESVQVTPNYLQQIEVSHCPITRAPIGSPLLDTSDASVDRVRNDAGYAAGNLAMMSVKANHAKAAWGYPEAQAFARQIASGARDEIDGLDGAQWRRVATLCSFVQAMPHAEACELPMHLLPPNRLRLFNPVQALQAFVSRQFLKAGWSQRIGRFEALLPGADLQRDFKRFFISLLPRVIESGACGDKRGAAATRWAVEDAWDAPAVQQRWAHFARQLTAAQCELLLARATARGLGHGIVMAVPSHRATDGWNLHTRGYLPHVNNVLSAPSAACETHQLPLSW